MPVPVGHLKGRGYQTGYIKRVLASGSAAALRWSYKRASCRPSRVITVADGEPRERTLEADEIEPYGPRSRLPTYRLRRHLMLLLNTATAAQAARQPTVFQVDLARNRLDLNPAGPSAHQQAAARAHHCRAAAMADRRRPREAVGPRRSGWPCGAPPATARAWIARRGTSRSGTPSRRRSTRPIALRTRSPRSRAGSSTANARLVHQAESIPARLLPRNVIAALDGWMAELRLESRTARVAARAVLFLNPALRARNLQAEVATGGQPLENSWSGRRDSNPRPQPWQGCALPLSYARTAGRNRRGALCRGTRMPWQGRPAGFPTRRPAL